MKVYKRGNNWCIDYTYKGHRTRRKVGTDKKIAELALKDIELKIAKGEFLGIYEKKKVLLEDFAVEYLKFSQANKAPKSYGRDITSLKVNLIPYFKGNYLPDITSKAIEEYKLKRLEKVAPATVNRELACLRHLYSKAVEWECCTINPVKKVKFFKEPPGRVRYLEDWEISMLLGECSPQIKPVVITALHTGMRRSELFNLKWEDIDFTNRIITVKDSKNNESRMIPMNETVFDTLRTIYSHGNVFVFYTPKGTQYKDIAVGFKGALKRAGIENFRFHDLRHTFGSRLAMKGWNIQTIQHLLGHKTIKMTMRYSHLSESYLKNAVASLDNRVNFGTNSAQETEARKEYVPKVLIDKQGASGGTVYTTDLKSVAR